MAMKKADLRAIIKNEDATDDEKLSSLLDVFHGEIDSIKDERDELKNELAELKKNDKTSEWEEKYNGLKKEYEEYKESREQEATKSKKETAYRALLKEAGVSEKRIDSIIKVTDISSIEIDENGAVKDSENHKKTISTEWADFIVSQDTKGANTETPPNNAGGQNTDLESLSMADYINARKK